MSDRKIHNCTNWRFLAVAVRGLARIVYVYDRLSGGLAATNTVCTPYMCMVVGNPTNWPCQPYKLAIQALSALLTCACVWSQCSSHTCCSMGPLGPEKPQQPWQSLGSCTGENLRVLCMVCVLCLCVCERECECECECVYVVCLHFL